MLVYLSVEIVSDGHKNLFTLAERNLIKISKDTARLKDKVMENIDPVLWNEALERNCKINKPRWLIILQR